MFNRILLVGRHPLYYLSGKFSSTVCLVLLQTTFVFLFTQITLNLFSGRQLTFWLGLILILVACQSLSRQWPHCLQPFFFRLKDHNVALSIATIIIIVFGVIGGSFTPVFALPDWLRQVGEWTPNGLIISIYTQWVQQEDYTQLMIPIMLLLLFALLLISLSIWIFPRRGRI